MAFGQDAPALGDTFLDLAGLRLLLEAFGLLDLLMTPPPFLDSDLVVVFGLHIADRIGLAHGPVRRLRRGRDPLLHHPPVLLDQLRAVLSELLPLLFDGLPQLRRFIETGLCGFGLGIARL